MTECVNTEQDIIERVESEVGSLAGTLAHMDFIGPRAHAKIRNLIYWDLPKLVKETKKLRAEVARLQGLGVQYDYAVQRTDDLGGIKVLSDYWFRTIEEAQDFKDVLTKRWELYRLPYTAEIVKRRRAGKVEKV